MQNQLQIEPEHTEIANQLALKIIDGAKQSNTEEDLKMKIQPLLNEALNQLGLEFQVDYEKLIYGTKRADVLYSNVVLEYKRPNSLNNISIIKKAKEEIENYFKGLLKERGVVRPVGIILDGYQIIFARPKLQLQKTYQKTIDGDMIQILMIDYDGPHNITPQSVSKMLLYLRQLNRKVLTAENLSNDFGSEKGVIGRSTIQTLYANLINSKSVKTQTLYNEWKRIFGIVYGESLEKLEKKENEFIRLYKITGSKIDLQKLLFCVHTYFALIMKMIAAEIVVTQHNFLSSFAKKWSMLDDEELKKAISDLESGILFKIFDINNFLEGDLFSWYIEDWSQMIVRNIRSIANSLSFYEIAGSSIEPLILRDLLKKLYQYLIPSSIRHDLGEYYTPDWLAELVIMESKYDGDPVKRVLDPACGSGTFIVQIIGKIIERHENYPEQYTAYELMELILNNVVGFDINPIAVLAARTNYLLAISSIRGSYTKTIDIPIYMTDSILMPQYLVDEGSYKIRTTVTDFNIPSEIIESRELASFLSIFENVISYKASFDVLLERIANMFNKETIDRIKPKLLNLYKTLYILEEEKKDHIWFRIIKNSFAPIYAGIFDYVIGNPPWIRWGFLSYDYRNATEHLWKDYGLFSLKGMAAILGGGEKDFSMLFTYACMDYYLKEKGILVFLITQEVFKAKGAGEGFRNFKLGESGSSLKVVKAHDLVHLMPFEGASNKTAMILLIKGEETTYPIPYVLWKRNKGVGKIDPTLTFPEVLALTNRTEQIARPIAKLTSQWQTYSPGKEDTFFKMKKPSDYKAYRGASLDPYGVYFVKILEKIDLNNIIIQNCPELGKKKIDKNIVILENKLVYPAIRGKDITRWGSSIEYFVINSQDPIKRKGFDEEWLMINLPKTYSYFHLHKEVLLTKALYWKYFSKTLESESDISNEIAKKYKYWRYIGVRNGKHQYQVSDEPYYAIFNVAEHIFANWKVVWQRMANDMKATVILKIDTIIGPKSPIPTDTTAYIPCENETEAHYICALLNSEICRSYIKSFTTAGRGFGAPSIMKHINISKFENGNDLHIKLSNASINAHKAKKENNMKYLLETEKEINHLSNTYWDVKSYNKDDSLEENIIKTHDEDNNYDPILDKFLSSKNNLVQVFVEGVDTKYLEKILKKRIKLKKLTNEIKMSVINNILYLEKN